MEDDEGRIILYMIFVLRFDSESFLCKYFISLKTNTTKAGMVLLQWQHQGGWTRGQPGFWQQPEPQEISDKQGYIARLSRKAGKDSRQAGSQFSQMRNVILKNQNICKKKVWIQLMMQSHIEKNNFKWTVGDMYSKDKKIHKEIKLHLQALPTRRLILKTKHDAWWRTPLISTLRR